MWDIPFIKLFWGTAIGLLIAYVAIRLIAYAVSKSWHQAKQEYENNKENNNGEKEES